MGKFISKVWTALGVPQRQDVKKINDEGLKEVKAILDQADTAQVLKFESAVVSAAVVNVATEAIRQLQPQGKIAKCFAETCYGSKRRGVGLERVKRAKANIEGVLALTPDKEHALSAGIDSLTAVLIDLIGIDSQEVYGTLEASLATRVKDQFLKIGNFITNGTNIRSVLISHPPNEFVTRVFKPAIDRLDLSFLHSIVSDLASSAINGAKEVIEEVVETVVKSVVGSGASGMDTVDLAIVLKEVKDHFDKGLIFGVQQVNDLHAKAGRKYAPSGIARKLGGVRSDTSLVTPFIVKVTHSLLYDSPCFQTTAPVHQCFTAVEKDALMACFWIKDNPGRKTRVRNAVKDVVHESLKRCRDDLLIKLTDKMRLKTLVVEILKKLSSATKTEHQALWNDNQLRSLRGDLDRHILTLDQSATAMDDSYQHFFELLQEYQG
jgi:hypothetical protein